MQPSIWASGFWPLAMSSHSVIHGIPSHMTIKRSCTKLVLLETHPQPKYWKWNCALLSPRASERAGTISFGTSMVNLHFLVGIHQLKLSQRPLRILPMWICSGTKTMFLSLHSVYSDDKIPQKHSSLSPEAVKRQGPVSPWLWLCEPQVASQQLCTWRVVSCGVAGSPGSYKAGSVPSECCGACAASWFSQKSQGWNN